MKIEAPSISRWKEGIEQTIDTLLKVYARRTPPSQLMAFRKFIAGARATSKRDGWSPAKQFLLYGHCPRKIFYMMVKLFGPEWRNKPDVVRAFWSRARAFRIRPYGGLPMTRAEWADEPNRDFSIKPCKTTRASPSTSGPLPTWRSETPTQKNLPLTVYDRNAPLRKPPA